MAHATETKVTIICDGPKCAERHKVNAINGGASEGFPTTIVFFTEKMKSDPFSVPDAFFRLIEMVVDPGSRGTVTFCSMGCAKDYLTYVYQVPESPREQREKQIREAELDAKKKAAESGPQLVREPDDLKNAFVKNPGIIA